MPNTSIWLWSYSYSIHTKYVYHQCRRFNTFKKVMVCESCFDSTPTVNRLAPRPPLRAHYRLEDDVYTYMVGLGGLWLSVCRSVSVPSVHVWCCWARASSADYRRRPNGVLSLSLLPPSPLKSHLLKLHQLSWLCCSSLAVADSGGDQWKASKRFRSRLGSSPPCPGTELQSGFAQLSWVTLTQTAALGVGISRRVTSSDLCCANHHHSVWCESGDSSA